MSILKSFFGASNNVLSAPQAKALLDGEKTPFILDVRQPDEFRAGHIAGATLIPLNDLPQRMNELPRDREILCVCRSGARSGAAARQLSSAGYQAINLQGGMIGWQIAGFPIQKGK